MKTKQILSLKKIGKSNDDIYQIAASQYSLFGIAFFGHKGSKVEKQKLNRVWDRILKTI